MNSLGAHGGAFPFFNNQDVRVGLKDHQFCRFSGQQSPLFLGAGHSSTLAAEDNAQSVSVL